MAIPSKMEQRLTQGGPAEGVPTTSSRGRPKSKFLSAFLLTVVLLPSTTSAAVGLVAEYSFNEGVGTTVSDASGNSNHGIVSGASWSTLGKYGGALSFDGVNDWVTINDSASLDLTNGMTLEAWVQPTTFANWKSVILKERPGDFVYAFYTNANRPSVWIQTSSSTGSEGASQLPLNSWSHLAATYDGSALRLYVNGVQVSSQAATGNIIASADPLRIGGNSIWSSEFFNGLIDEVRIYNRALTQAEIQTDMNTAVGSAPTLTITQPAQGSTVAGTTVNVTYVESGTINPGDHPHFTLDSNPEVMDVDNDGSYQFVNVPAGNHTLTGYLAKADHTKILGTDTSRSFTTTTPDTTAPTVSITAPPNEATVSGTLNVTADASDNVGVVGVQFKLDGANLGAEDTTSPYSVSWTSTTAANGVHTLTAIARDGAANQTTSSPVTVTVANADPRAQVGEWGPILNWPIVAVHASLMSTGQVLIWDALEFGTTLAKVWDPATSNFTDTPVNSQLFCSAHSSLADGRLLVTGGHNGSEVGIVDASIFNPTSSVWIEASDMSFARWYPSNTTLSDGRVLVLSGQVTHGVFADTPEIYNPSTNSWSNVSVSTSDMHEEDYPLTFLMPNGKLYVVSATLGLSRILDLNAPSWTAGSPLNTNLGSVAMYQPGKFLYTGGGDIPGSGQPSNSLASVVDMNQPSPPSPAWRAVSPMANARYKHNLVVMPDGKVMAIGGAPIVSRTTATGTLPSEIWDPVTETWVTVASIAESRNYHSIALLLPDGRILSAGGGRLETAPNRLTAQIYSPPYLFTGARPTITSAPTSGTYGETITVQTPDLASITKVSLIPPGSVTHTLDMNQRYLELNFTTTTALQVRLPSDANLAPPGYYMLFIVNSNGVPSAAKILRIGPPDTDITAPVISNISSGIPTTTAATITWTTDEISDSQVEYGLDVNYGSSTTLNANLVTNHSQTLTGLTASTTYHYRVKSKDASGNLATSADFIFTTAATGP